ncbi:MAG: tRNA (adenosine(37)-N6)-threonylcarbamoyltransferase complex dimerization subunit type 1 TsaB [Myxococcales bacterium]|nr:tRNA (adenosine(37)-N6)-threonylcarbamoyltransferase complex dimerization subunit type 1 TsaB [Myxococcales bacterium]
MNVLAITTSTPTVGVWLRTDAGFAAGRTCMVARGQARPLTEAIWALLAAARLDAADLQRIACDIGPGSFTGLRMGLATARALAWAHAVPCVGVGSLPTLVAALRAAGWTGPCAVALPARTGVAYVGWSDAGIACEETLLTADDFAGWWPHRASGRAVAVAGSGWHAAGWLRAAAGPAATDVGVADAPVARAIAELAESLPSLAAHDLLPRYLQDSHAERHQPV